jgi:hypothetical protein
MKKPNTFLTQVIWAFAAADGAIPLTRGDAYGLFREVGWSAKEADCMAFASFVPKAPNEEPYTVAGARAILIARGTLIEKAAA